MEAQEALDFIKAQDPEGGERLIVCSTRNRAADRNVYGERFTDRQFEPGF